ncbi:MAG: hypothetical protein E7029_12860 [Planctomycetaceae bacterium]|nr:hypothetical protein [Planctomycetaceae bacterium]
MPCSRVRLSGLPVSETAEALADEEPERERSDLPPSPSFSLDDEQPMANKEMEKTHKKSRTQRPLLLLDLREAAPSWLGCGMLQANRNFMEWFLDSEKSLANDRLRLQLFQDFQKFNFEAVG